MRHTPRCRGDSHACAVIWWTAIECVWRGFRWCCCFHFTIFHVIKQRQRAENERERVEIKFKAEQITQEFFPRLVIFLQVTRVRESFPGEGRDDESEWKRSVHVKWAWTSSLPSFPSLTLLCNKLSSWSESARLKLELNSGSHPCPSHSNPHVVGSHSSNIKRKLLRIPHNSRKRVRVKMKNSNISKISYQKSVRQIEKGTFQKHRIILFVFEMKLRLRFETFNVSSLYVSIVLGLANWVQRMKIYGKLPVQFPSSLFSAPTRECE